MLPLFCYAVFALNMEPKGSKASAQERAHGQYETVYLHNIVLFVQCGIQPVY